jgi:hypothetical protein
MLVMGIFIAVISWIPVVGNLISLFFATPFSVIYMYLIYEDLRRIKG